ncbi:MAG: antibiotic biosynthesis monooxygenase [Saprospiraceae bacterium]|nr:antibiotic biosynthesis monooxygenase [Saprospiraceae bacterium]
MILRIWHGYTTKSNADTYEHLLKTEIFPEIENKKIKGYRRIQLLRREMEDETEFTTIMWFDSIESVIDFVGVDYETVYVPEKARKVLSRFDNKSIHCELRETYDNNF